MVTSYPKLDVNIADLCEPQHGVNDRECFHLLLDVSLGRLTVKLYFGFSLNLGITSLTLTVGHYIKKCDCLNVKNRQHFGNEITLRQRSDRLVDNIAATNAVTFQSEVTDPLDHIKHNTERRTHRVHLCIAIK
jgi:hypothetical protein